MVDDARTKTGGFTVAVVHSWSRFFRDLFLAEWYRLRLEKLGVRVISITQDFGDDTQGRLMRQIFGAFDEYSSAETSKHVLRTMIKNARDGFVNGRPPFGYKSVTVEKRGDKEKKKFVIHEEEAEIVRLIFSLSLGGLSGFDPMGVKEISKELDRRNIKKRSDRSFNSTEIHEILKSTTYIGRLIYNRRDYRARQDKPPEEWVIMEVPAIIDDDTFEAVQRSLASRDPTRNGARFSGHPTLLSSLARCGTCGSGMKLMSGKSGRFRYYKCVKALKNIDGGCSDPRTIREDLLDRLVTEYLSEIMFEPKRLRSLLDEAVKIEQETQDQSPKEIDRLVRKKSDLDSQISRMHKAIRLGTVEPDDLEFRQMLDATKSERADVDFQLKRLRESANTIPPLTAQRVREFSVALRSAIQIGDIRARRAYLRFFLARVVVRKREINLVGHKGLLGKAYANDWQQAIMAQGDLRRNSVPPQVDSWWSQPGSNR